PHPALHSSPTRRSSDLDMAAQIRMPSWSTGRVALVGDAAYAPSFLTGQGSSLALVGAYMLASSLAAHQGHAAAFRAYERDTRERSAEHTSELQSRFDLV